MRKTKFLKRRTPLKNNNRRRLLLKRAHQKVLQRRKMFINDELFTDLARAC